MKKFNIENSKYIIVGLALAISFTYSFAAWTNPTALPPTNASEPLNVGTTTQTKIGSIIASSTGAGAFCLYNGNYSGNAGCIQTWPTGGGVPSNVVKFSPSPANTTITGSWVVPAGVTKVEAILVAGGSSAIYPQSGVCTSAYSGASGAAMIAEMTVTPGASLSYQVGAGGKGGNGTSAAGSATSFNGLSVGGGAAAPCGGVNSNTAAGGSLVSGTPTSGSVSYEYFPGKKAYQVTVGQSSVAGVTVGPISGVGYGGITGWPPNSGSPNYGGDGVLIIRY